MVKKTAVVPDAWEDDWEAQADRAGEDTTQQEPPPQAPSSRAERLARHAETNRKLWESAETPETFHFVEASNSVPFASAFKPQVKVLSRKPVIAKRDPVTGLSQLTIDDDDDADAAKGPALSPEAIRARQKREREEKQRRYEEARAKIFGDSVPSSGASSPGNVTPPKGGRPTAQGGRGRAPAAGANRTTSDVRQIEARRANMQPGSARELFDPQNTATRPDLLGLRRGGDADSPGRVATPKEQPAIRAPRGPDGSGRGGFGFAKRGGNDG